MQFDGSSMAIDFDGTVANKTEFKLESGLNLLVMIYSSLEIFLFDLMFEDIFPMISAYFFPSIRKTQ